MDGVIFDTSALIQFADPQKPRWRAARDYYEACLANSIPMFLSSVVAGEFHIRQPISDLPLQNFQILGYELTHATQAARLYKLNERYDTAKIAAAKTGVVVVEKDDEDSRRIIKNDVKIFAQAEEEDIPFILTGDRRTLYRMVERLRQDGLTRTRALALQDGFSRANLGLPPVVVQLPLSGSTTTEAENESPLVQPDLLSDRPGA